MKDQRCFDRDTLLLYHSAGLPAEMAADVAAHLSTCDRCTDIIATLRPLSAAEVRDRHWGRVDRHLARARALEAPPSPDLSVVHRPWRDVLARLAALLGPLPLALAPARGEGGAGPRETLPARRELVLFEGRVEAVSPPLWYVLRLVLEPQRKKTARGANRNIVRRRFECQLADETGQPVGGRNLRLSFGDGGPDSPRGRLGTALARTGADGVARYPVWLGGAWLEDTYTVDLELDRAKVSPAPSDEFRLDLIEGLGRLEGADEDEALEPDDPLEES
jgi:hypothetical protein